MGVEHLGVLGAEPRLELRIRDWADWPHTLIRPTAAIGIGEDSRLQSPGSKAPCRNLSGATGSILGTDPRICVQSLVNTMVPLNVANWQSVPVKLASMRVAFAVPTLPNVPRHPRGDWNSPWVLIWAGGVLPGVSAVGAVVSIVNHGCVDWIVARNVWRFVCGTASKVQTIGPLEAGGAPGSPALTWISRCPPPRPDEERRLNGWRGRRRFLAARR